MVDLDALREWIAYRDSWIQGTRITPPTWFDESIDHSGAFLREFLRLLETAETVNWCLEHKALQCCEAHPDSCTEVEPSFEVPDCRMVGAVLTRREPEPETELDRNSLGVW